MPVAVCPYCGVSFPLPPGSDRQQARCPRCGKAPPGKGAPSPWLVVAVVLLAVLVLLALGVLAYLDMPLGGGERLPGL